MIRIFQARIAVPYSNEAPIVFEVAHSPGGEVEEKQLFFAIVHLSLLDCRKGAGLLDVFVNLCPASVDE